MKFGGWRGNGGEWRLGAGGAREGWAGRARREGRMDWVREGAGLWAGGC